MYSTVHLGRDAPRRVSEEYCSSFLMLVAVTFVIFVIVKIIERWKFDKQLNIPYGWSPTRWMPLGYELTGLAMQRDNPNIGNLVMSTIQGFSSAFESVGLYRFYLLFRPIVVLVSPEAAESLLANSNLTDKGFFYKLLNPWLGLGLLTSSGAKWRSRRKLLTPAFHFCILENFMPVFNEQSLLMGDLLLADSMQRTIDICKRATNCTLDIICETAMGVKVNAQKDDNSAYVRAVYALGASFLRRCMRPWQWLTPVYYCTPEGRRYRDNLNILHGFTRKVISERNAQLRKLSNEDRHVIDCHQNNGILGAKKKKAFLDLLLERHLRVGDLNLVDIQEEVDTFMFEGHDTTAMALSWCIYLIGLDRAVQQRVHRELDEVFGLDRFRPVTFGDLPRLKYLDCCIKESQRLYPSVPFIARDPCQNVQIGKFQVPRGTTCIINIFHIHRNKKYFPDPEVFRPERFLPENSIGRHPYAFIPFSAGSRNCIGQKFAQLEEKVVLTNIFRRFEIHSVTQRDQVVLVGEMVVRSQNGLHVRVSKR